MDRRIIRWLSWLLLLGTWGCGENLRCGAGTELRDGFCVAASDVSVNACGRGTIRQGDRCVLPGTQPDTSETCTPDCEGRDCGFDGCGGVCGLCTDDAKPFCDLAEGQCTEVACVPTCPPEWACGDDGCGGECGACDAATPFCSPNNTCVETCVPSCDGRTCGDDGCGGSCGECEGQATCNNAGTCVPESWECAPGSFGDGILCDCACGAPDPDCEMIATDMIITNCAPFQTCDPSGACADTIPTGWTCEPGLYEDGLSCDCACGVPDPDCQDAMLPVSGCTGDATCMPDGTCSACVPDCVGKMCGNDGCGGSCGECTDPGASMCFEGQCTNMCSPRPLLCDFNECGDDGCGGSCGACGQGEVCVAGGCEPEVDPNSCAGICGQTAPGGCSCEAGCVDVGTCCADYEPLCSMCVPDCANKQCGDDGCGGSCGMCNDPIFSMCEPTQGRCVDPQCIPECTGATCGDDGCGGLCGTCGPGEVCFELDRACAPEGWSCPPFLISDGFCDCGCGLVDPDCTAMQPQGSGCPLGVTCDPAAATCQGTRCRTPGACGAGELCVGAYHDGGRRLTGLCEIKAPTMPGATGAPCLGGPECDSGVCAFGTCAEHCINDTSCSGGQRCVGVEDDMSLRMTPNGLTPAGWVAVCADIPGTATVCATDVDCGMPGEACLPFIDGNTLGVRRMCAILDTMAVSAPCGLAMMPMGGFGLCPAGLTCTLPNTGFEPVCARPCFGGVSDCLPGESCAMTTINDQNTASTQDDVLLPVCVP